MKRRDFLKSLLAIPALAVIGKAVGVVPDAPLSDTYFTAIGWRGELQHSRLQKTREDRECDELPSPKV